MEPAHHPRPQIPKQLEGVFLGIPFQTEVGLVKPNAEHIEADLVLALGPAGGQFYRPVGAIYRRDKVLSPAMKQFLNMLKG